MNASERSWVFTKTVLESFLATAEADQRFQGSIATLRLTCTTIDRSVNGGLLNQLPVVFETHGVTYAVPECIHGGTNDLE